MGSLFLVELASFLAKTTQSTIVVDFNRDQQVCAAEGERKKGWAQAVVEEIGVVGERRRTSSCPNLTRQMSTD